MFKHKAWARSKVNDYCVYVPTNEGSGLVLETRLGGGNKCRHLNEPSIGSTENLNFFTCQSV